MSKTEHDGTGPASAQSVDVQVDSAATTLLPSANSSDPNIFSVSGKKYADIELERYDRETEFSAQNASFGKDLNEETHHLLYGQTGHTILDDEDTKPSALQHGSSDTPLPSTPLSEPEPVSWSSLPKKSQLAIMTLCRLSEPLTQTSLQSYMFYQLKSFKLPDGSAPSDSTVAAQAGALAAAFTGAQFMTAMLWGRVADSERMGRKRVILIGLLGTCIGTLGFGFSDSFTVAVFWRAVGGMLNGNIGVMRTMVSEIVKEKKYQSRAFLLLPMTFNIGVIIGPLLGGLLADPVSSYPEIFGPGGTLGGERGVWLFQRWPYVLPNLVSASFLFLGAMGVTFGLEETLEGRRDKPDFGLLMTRWLARMIRKRAPEQRYTPLDELDRGDDIELSSAKPDKKSKTRRKLPFKRIWTPNVLFTLLSHGLLAMHVGTFNSMWFVFLSTPRYLPANAVGTQTGTNTTNDKLLQLPPNYKPHLPFTFTGGLALPPPSIGTALSILGVIGISLQLLLYPRLSFYLGTIRSYRLALLLFPIAYALTPFLAIIPSSKPAPEQASGALVWLAITFVLIFQVLARTFALPATAILVNNCSPHPSVLGTIHGIGQSVSSGTRTVGPVLAGWLYGFGLNHGVVGLAWWGLAVIGILGVLASQLVKEGDGHEIWLPGEKEELEEDK